MYSRTTAKVPIDSRAAETVWQFYTRSEEAWEAMLAACRNASASIDLETYILENDSVGKEFLETLAQKASAGVRVRVIADGIGSWGLYTSNLPAELRTRGVEIRFFNPLRWWQLAKVTSWFFRDHRKNLIVDSRLGFTGGVGIRELMASWRDTHLALTGPVVEDMENVFNRMWTMLGRSRYMRFPKPKPPLSGFSFLTNSPHFRQRFLYRSFVAAVRAASSRIDITTPYFIPDLRFFRVLRLAAKRGVAVRVLLPGSSDHPFVDRVSDSFIAPALRYGLRVFKYGGEMLHAKTMLIDDAWTTVGSSNIDNLSFSFNHEGNIVSDNKAFAAEVSEHFEADIIAAREIIAKEWSRRPLWNRFLEFLLRPIGGIM
jgi:cardiolipin synthase